MPRPQRCRRICGLPRVGAFGPQEGRAEAPIVLTLDEYEVIRLVDLEEKTQGACAAQMDVSRSTVQEIYESARKKIAACLVYGRPWSSAAGTTASAAAGSAAAARGAGRGLCRSARTPRTRTNKKEDPP